MRRFDRFPERTPEKVPEKPFDRPSLISKTHIHFRARTMYRWVDAVVVSTQRRLNDVLNREDTAGFLIVEDVEISDVSEGFGGKIERAEFGCLNTNSVLFVVLLDDGGSDTTNRDAFAWVKKRAEKVKVGIGPYEIIGETFMIEDAKLRDAISTPKPVFIVLKSATVHQLDGDGSSVDYDAVFVNRRYMDYIAPINASGSGFG